jgi:hypothetical protein
MSMFFERTKQIEHGVVLEDGDESRYNGKSSARLVILVKND